MGRCGVRISPHLGCPLDAGGGPRRPRRREEPPSNRVGCGGLRGEEKWRLDRTSAPEGWLGGGRVSHTWGDPQGLRSGGGCQSRADWAGRPARLPGQILCPQRPLPGHIGPRVVGEREEGGRKGETDGERGTLQDREIREGVAGVSPTHLAPGSLQGSQTRSLALQGPLWASLVLGV